MSLTYTTKTKSEKVKVKSLGNKFVFNFSLLVFSFSLFYFSAAAQRIAVLAPDGSDASRNFARRLEARLAEKFRVLDDAMSEAAFGSAKPENPFNLTVENSKAIGTAIGCDHFILVRSATLRRSASRRPEYYESHAAIYAVSSRTGRLVFWRLSRFEGQKPQDSQNLLNDAAEALALEIEKNLRLTAKNEMAESRQEMEEPPEEGSPAAKNFRAPVPYRRIKPEYTADAFLYDVKGTVDIVVDLDRNGSILRTEIVRWAGYGLDESVEKTVRSMNWRPAERNGKPLPMRFLLRYNFKKIEKE